jgi:chloride channel 7
MGTILSKWPLGAVQPLPQSESADFVAVVNSNAPPIFRSSHRQRAVLRWFCFTMVGALSAFLYWIIDFFITKLQNSKFEILHAHIAAEEYGSAWVSYFGFMILFVWSSLLLVLWVPVASGGGVPEVIAFLNGSWTRGIFELKTLVVKSVALILSVSSGLAIGY